MRRVGAARGRRVPATCSEHVKRPNSQTLREPEQLAPLKIVLLVAVLRAPPGLRRPDGGGDGDASGGERVERLAHCSLLVGRVPPNGALVLRLVRPTRRVVHLEEEPQELLVSDDGRVEAELDGLRVAVVCADGAVGRRVGAAACVANLRRDNAFEP